MRNPWLEFESPHLGRLCARLGGGGHRRVGSAVFRDERAAEARAALEWLVAAILEEERARARVPAGEEKG